MKAEQFPTPAAGNIVSRILEDLLNRTGFQDTWNAMSTDAQHRLVDEWLQYADSALNGYTMLADSYDPHAYCREVPYLPRERATEKEIDVLRPMCTVCNDEQVIWHFDKSGHDWSSRCPACTTYRGLERYE